MPTVSPSPWGPKPIFTLASGLPAVGYKLFAYLAGSVGTKTDTYTNSTGTVANTNPVVLDVNGTPPAEWWWANGLALKIVFAPAADTDPPTSPIWTVDNVRGIGDATITPSEWVASSLVPTFISTTSFSLVGDQTATFHVGRRLKSTNSSGFIYSTIALSLFSSVTTVTVVNDSGVLDSGLTAVSYGIISAVNSSDPFEVSGSGDVVGPGSSTDGHIVQFNGVTGKIIKDGLLLDTDGTLITNSDTRVASQKAVKTYVDANIGSGDVVGPAGVLDSNFAQFDGATGKLIKGGLSLDVDGTLSADSDSRVATQKAVKTYVDAAGGTPGHVIEDEGTPLTQRPSMNFVGGGVAVTDAGGKTVVTIAAAQPLDSDLTTIAGLTATTDNFMQAKSSAWASRTVAQVSADLQGTGLITDAVGFRTIPQNSQSAAYTTVAADAGKHLLHPSADTTARIFTIDSNANVAYPVGTAITFVNQASAGVMTIAITSDTMRLAGAGTTGSRTLAANGIATALKVTSTEWIVSGTGLT